MPLATYYTNLLPSLAQAHANVNASIQNPQNSAHSAEDYKTLTSALKNTICSSNYFCTIHPDIGGKSTSEKKEAFNILKNEFANLILDQASECNFSEETTQHFINIVTQLSTYQDQGEAFKGLFDGQTINVSPKNESRLPDWQGFYNEIDKPLSKLCYLLNVIDIPLQG